MDPVVIAIVVIVVIAAFCGLVWLGRRKHKRLEAENERLRRNADAGVSDNGAAEMRVVTPTPDKVQPGWYFSHPEYGNGQPVLVNGVMTCDEEGYIWRELRTENAGGVRMWVSVEQSEKTCSFEYVLWHELDGNEYKKKGDKVTHDGLVYEWIESGKVDYSTVGETDMPNLVGTLKYDDYRAVSDPDRRISLEAFNGGKREASAGRVLDATFVRLEPPGKPFSL